MRGPIEGRQFVVLADDGHVFFRVQDCSFPSTFDERGRAEDFYSGAAGLSVPVLTMHLIGGRHELMAKQLCLFLDISEF
jgi:hypothetical protein